VLLYSLAVLAAFMVAGLLLMTIGNRLKRHVNVF